MGYLIMIPMMADKLQKDITDNPKMVWECSLDIFLALDLKELLVDIVYCFIN